MCSLPFSPETLLDAQEGIVYATSEDGVIAAVGRPNWRAFADRNAVNAALRPEALVGKNLFDYVRGEPVREFYRMRMRKLSAGEARTVTFAYRCDSSSIARHMRMSISVIRADGGGAAGFLFQSLLLSDEMRPPMDIFDTDSIAAAFAGDKRPIVTLCSICQRLRDGKPPSATWISPEMYYRDGGSGDVRLSHGICPNCVDAGTFVN